jgi:hypothetical protein
MNVMTAAIGRRRKIKKMTKTTTKKQSEKRRNLSGGKARPAQQAPTVAPSKAKPARKAASTKRAGATRKLGNTASQGSKTAAILDLLKRPGGVTLKELMKATGWQPHSVRGFLSGTLKKKMAMPFESFKSADGDRTYRVASK